MPLPIFDVNKSIKENGIIKTAVFLLLVILIVVLVEHNLPFTKNTNTQNVNFKLEEKQNEVKGEKTQSLDNLAKKSSAMRFEDHLDDWSIKFFDSATNDGFYCPSFFSPYQSPDIWYKHRLPVSFNSLFITYKLRSRIQNKPSTFIISLSEDGKKYIWRFYAPHNNYQLVGFQKILVGGVNDLEWEKGQELSKPIQKDSIINLNIRSQVRKGNEVNYLFNIKYISDSTTNPVEDSFSYDVKLSDPNPLHSDAVVGVATLKENCLKPISYEFIP